VIWLRRTPQFPKSIFSTFHRGVHTLNKQERIRDILWSLIEHLAGLLEDNSLSVGEKIRVSQALTTAINTWYKIMGEAGDEEIDLAQILSKIPGKSLKNIEGIVKEYKKVTKYRPPVAPDILLIIKIQDLLDQAMKGDGDALDRIVKLIVKHRKAYRKPYRKGEANGHR